MLFHIARYTILFIIGLYFQITLLEEPPEEEAFPVFMDTQAFKSLVRMLHI